MKLLLITVIAIVRISCAEPVVYVCRSKSAMRYHISASCRGLRNCSYKIDTVTLDSAKRMNKTLCKFEKLPEK